MWFQRRVYHHFKSPTHDTRGRKIMCLVMSGNWRNRLQTGWWCSLRQRGKMVHLSRHCSTIRQPAFKPEISDTTYSEEIALLSWPLPHAVCPPVPYPRTSQASDWPSPTDPGGKSEQDVHMPTHIRCQLRMSTSSCSHTGHWSLQHPAVSDLQSHSREVCPRRNWSECIGKEAWLGWRVRVCQLWTFQVHF